MSKIGKGSQGSWEVSTRFGKLPCVHQYYWRVDERGPYYHDPRATPDGYAHGAKFEKHIALIRSAKKVVLTEDVINKNHSEGADGFFSRVDYVGIFEIDDPRWTIMVCSFVSSGDCNNQRPRALARRRGRMFTTFLLDGGLMMRSTSAASRFSASAFSTS